MKMKRSLILILLFIVATSAVEAQSHRAGNLFATAGIGLAHYGYHTVGPKASIGLPLTLNVDYGLMDYVSLGGYFGVLFKDRSSAVGFGGRGSFHFWQMINDLATVDLMGDTFDIYASIYSGGEVSGRYTDRFRIGGILGGRYFFSQNIAVTAEFGGPMSYFMAGVSFKLLD